MDANYQKILDHYNKESTESMEDMNQVTLEQKVIMQHIRPNTIILDCGCGEGTSTLRYSQIEGARIIGLDFSETRIKKAQKLLADISNVNLVCSDIMAYSAPGPFDHIISQRFISNMTSWEMQSAAIDKMMSMLDKDGTLILMEGSLESHNSMNTVRELLGMPPIPIKWHNLFINDAVLEKHMKDKGYHRKRVDGIGAYIFLTRIIRPMLDKTLNWDAPYNTVLAEPWLNQVLPSAQKYSRIKLWEYGK